MSGVNVNSHEGAGAGESADRSSLIAIVSVVGGVDAVDGVDAAVGVDAIGDANAVGGVDSIFASKARRWPACRS